MIHKLCIAAVDNKECNAVLDLLKGESNSCFLHHIFLLKKEKCPFQYGAGGCVFSSVL